MASEPRYLTAHRYHSCPPLRPLDSEDPRHLTAHRYLHYQQPSGQGGGFRLHPCSQHLPQHPSWDHNGTYLIFYFPEPLDYLL